MALWALLALSLCACAKEPKRKHGGLRQHAGAVLTGTVRLAADALLPRYANADMVRHPLQPLDLQAPPSACEAANQTASQPVKLAAKRGLAGVVVAASDFVRAQQHERTPKMHEIAIRNCTLTPQTLTATVGDTVVIVNEDQRDYAPMFGPLLHAAVLPPGERVAVPLGGAGIESVMCARQAPCGRTDVVAFHHDVHTVTDAQGHFRLEGFPAGESVRVSAWHPLFEVSETFVWVEPNQEREAELVLRPRAGL